MAKYWYTNVQHAEAYVQRHLFIYFKLGPIFWKKLKIIAFLGEIDLISEMCA